MIKKRVSFTCHTKLNDGMSIDSEYYNTFMINILGLNKMKRSFSESDIKRHRGKLSRREYILGDIYNLNKKPISCLEAWVNIPDKYKYRVLVLLRDFCIRYNNTNKYVSIHICGAPKNISIGKAYDKYIGLLIDFVLEKERPILKIQKWAKRAKKLRD